MKNIYLHILVAMSMLTLVACEKDNAEPDTGSVEAVFTASIEGGQSRAYDSTWETGDEIGIFSTTSSHGIKNVCLVNQNAEGAFTVKKADERIFYKANSVTFFAYYPYYNIGEVSSTNKAIYFDTSDQKNQKSFDFLYTTSNVTGTKSKPEVEFKFTHKMSKVTFVFRNGQKVDVRNIVAYRLGDLYLEGSFTICNISSPTSTTISNSSGTVSAITSGKKSNVEVQLSDVEENKPVAPLILIPQTITSPGLLTFEIERNDGKRFTAYLTFPNNKLEGARNYIFTITVNSSGLVVNDCSIKNWTDYPWSEGYGQGTADSADDPDE